MKSELKKIKGTTVNVGTQKYLLREFFDESTSAITQTTPNSTNFTTPSMMMTWWQKSTTFPVPPLSTGSTTKRTKLW